MTSTMLYHSLQQPGQQMSVYTYQQLPEQEAHRRHHHHHHHHRHHQHHRASPSPQLPTITSSLSQANTRVNTPSRHGIETPLPTPPNPSSAYFLDRIDLENYSTAILKQAVETVVAKTKAKGLKVKISLPDDGLVIENTTDLSRSWIFRTSDLLYFWRDSLFLNIIVVVTINRSRHRSTRPYSASIFRLRGTESAQSFLQQAQHYFDKLSASASTLTPTNTTAPVEKPTRPKSRPTDYNQSLNGRSKTKRRTTINEPFSSSILDRPHSSQTTAPIRLITRAEFDPGNMPAKPIANGHHRRTYSETASSNDSNSAESAKEILSFTRKLSYEDEDEEDDKMTTVSNNLSADYVADLLRELKDLRNEIAELKLEKRITPEKRSMSTSPLAIQSETHKPTRDSSNTTSSSSSFHDGTSQSEVDAETQTDFSLIAHRRRQSSRQNKRAMNGSSSISKAATRPAPPSAVEPARRPYQPTSTSTSSDHEETTQETSSQVNDPSHDIRSSPVEEQRLPTMISTPPRPVLLRSQHHFTPSTPTTSYLRSSNGLIVSYSNVTEEGAIPAAVASTKEVPRFLSTSSPSSQFIGPLVPTDFHRSADTSSASPEHIYENVPTAMQTVLNQASYYTIPVINMDQQQPTPTNGNGYYPTPDDASPEQPDNVSFHPTSRPTVSASPDSREEPPASPTEQRPAYKPQIVSTGRHRSQPVYFANHLTNPVFNIDKQLLMNTIANQFGVAPNSTQLQNLITNQHLFVTRKRTFANMIWQLTPDEETALCSSPAPSLNETFDRDRLDTGNSTARSILKMPRNFPSTSKRRTISWDNTLD